MAATALLAVLMLAVLGASTGAEWRTDTSPLPALPPADPAPTAVEHPTDKVVDDAEQHTAVIEVPGEVLAGIGAVLVGILLAAVLRLLLKLRRAEPDDDAPRRPLESAPAALEPDVAVLRLGTSRAQATLDRNLPPRDAVIAAWLAVEEAAAASGVPRANSQTPSEFTAAVLAATEADPGAIQTLLHLYHRARYGMGETARLSPADVATARACLDRLEQGWAVRA